MLIRSQDKKVIIDTKMVYLFEAEGWGRNFLIYGSNTFDYDHSVSSILGKYKTKERAIEIIDKINLIMEVHQMIDISGKLGLCGFETMKINKTLIEESMKTYIMPKE
jgi:hypothetical protein